MMSAGPCLPPILLLGASLFLAGCGSTSRHAPLADASGLQAVPVAGQSSPEARIPADKRIVDHTIQSGDSLWKLARDYGSSVKEIKAANAMTSDVIIAGQTLRIPTNLPEGTAPGSATASGPAAPQAPSAPEGLPEPVAPAVVDTATDLFR